MSFDFVPIHGGQYEALEKGRLDLVLNADDGAARAHLSGEMICDVDLVCVVSIGPVAAFQATSVRSQKT